jgi:hypothetical protein
MKKIIQLLILFILSNFTLIAQVKTNVNHQNLLWTRYYNQLELNTKWSIHSEFDNRIFLNPMVQNLFVVRVQGRYKVIDQTELGAGFAYFSVATQDPDIDSQFNKPEYRLQQDVTMKQNSSKINVNQRFQIEERFFQNFDSQSLQGGVSFAMRFRYRLQGDYMLWDKKNQYLKTIISDEIMINTTDKIVKATFDQNRIYAGLQYGINSTLAVEIGYMNSFQQRATGVDYYDRNIIRFSIYNKLKL